MKTCIRVALPGLLLGILLLQSAGAELNREDHLTDHSVMTGRGREEVNNDEEQRNKEQDQGLEDHLRSRPGHENSHAHLLTDEQRLPPRHTEHLGRPSSVAEHIGTMADSLCPSAAAIYPCVCTFDTDYNIDLDCTAVESEEQLANVFQQEFPVKELRGFQMTSNSAITVLGNILDGISFQAIDLSPGPFVLEEISDYFLLGSKDRLTYLTVFNSQLTSEHFPFSILAAMENLQQIDIDGSSITWIPRILAPKLSTLYINNAKTEIIESGTFPMGEGSLELYLRHNNISSVEPGSFYFTDDNSRTSNEAITINLYNSNLEFLEPETFVFRDGPMTVSLATNKLVSIAPGTFVMPATTDFFQLRLSVYNNNLETFDEDVFGEVMPFVTELDLESNPLLCGCDLAWLLTNGTYMSVLLGGTCADGKALCDIDPETYETNC